MAGQTIRYAELTCTPYTSVAAGIAAEAYCEAIEAARREVERDFGVTLRWCFDINGEDGIPAAGETARIATEIAPDGLISFGLGGPEIGWARPQFKPYFDQAIAAGLHSVPHAGESTGPQTIWDSLRELRAERIGHGTSSTQDPALLACLAEHDIALEVCPTSNIATKVVATLEEHPVVEMVAAGVPVTINSDDPPMFATTLSREYAIAADLLELDELGVGELAKAAVRASFAPNELKRSIAGEIDAYVAASVSRAGS
jgi:adenosine deaminase